MSNNKPYYVTYSVLKRGTVYIDASSIRDAEDKFNKLSKQKPDDLEKNASERFFNVGTSWKSNKKPSETNVIRLNPK